MFFRKSEPQITKEGIELIKYFEGCPTDSEGNAVAYRCQADKKTIGFGSLYLKDGTKVEDGMKITMQEAEELLAHELKKYEKYVRNYVAVDLNSDQFSSCVALCFNIGGNAFASSSALKKINAEEWDDVPEKIRLWNKITINGEKVVSDGLVARRQAESLLFQSKPWR